MLKSLAQTFLAPIPVLLALCGAAAAQDPATTTAPATPTANPTVVLHTSLGDVTLELFADKAPLTVENFLQYVNDRHYDGTIFHRVIDGFMIQGGGFTPDLRQKPTRAPIRNEADNGLSNTRGTVAMARITDPHSATAQFFINVVDNLTLDHVNPESGHTWGYAVFGKVVGGMDVVDQIRQVATGAMGPLPRDVPTTPVVITSAEVLP